MWLLQEIRYVERGICPVDELYLLRLTPLVKIFTAVDNKPPPNLKLSLFGTSDIIGHIPPVNDLSEAQELSPVPAVPH